MDDAWNEGQVVTMGPLRVRLVGTVGSTQEELWSKRRWAEEGTGIAASAQTAGEGRKGARWLSPKGGVYLSVLAGRGLPVADADVLGEAAALAVLRAAEELLKADDLFLKWPNDVVTWGPARRTGKLAGVLVRMETEGDAVAHATVGIGVNVREGIEKAPLGAKGAAAASLEGLARRRGLAWDASRTKVLEWVVGWFSVLLARARSDPEAVRREFGREVARAPLTARVEKVSERLRPLGVEQGGALVVRRASGKRATVSLGDAQRLAWTLGPRPKAARPRRSTPRKAKPGAPSRRAGAARGARPRSSRGRSARRASRSTRR